MAALAVAVFLFTRAMAAKERQVDSQVAASWYHTGQKFLRAGQIKPAIESLRRATSNDYENREYHLALAEALAQGGHNDEARYALLRLRESAPEDSEINLQLARLEAKRGDIAESIRYYHNALYGLWRGSHVNEQERNVRLELIHFLLDHQQRTQALSELLILESEFPADASAQTQLAQLFLAAGDVSHALKYFVRAVHMDKDSPEALAGAGEAAFGLGDYAQALRYLEPAVAIRNDDRARSLLSLAKLVVANDPLAPRISRDERNRRLKVDFDQALLRLETCIAQHSAPSDKAAADLQALHSDALTARQTLQPKDLRSDPELLDYGLELIDRMEEGSTASCGEPQGLDEALLLIGRKHKGAQR